MDYPQNSLLNGSVRYEIEYSWVTQKHTGISKDGGYSRGQSIRSYISPRTTTHLEHSNPCSAGFLASQLLGHLFRYLTGGKFNQICPHFPRWLTWIVEAQNLYRQTWRMDTSSNIITQMAALLRQFTLTLHTVKKPRLG